MGRFLDEPAAYVPKGKFLDEESGSVNGVATPIKKRFGGGADLAKSFALGGAPAFAMTPGAEDTLPAIGQTLGQSAGFAGSVGGAALGIGARDVIKGAREGNFKPAMQFGANPGLGFSEPKRMKETVATAATEGAFRGAGKILKPVLKAAQNRLMIAGIKPSKDVLQKNPRFGNDAAEAKLFGSLDSIKKKSSKTVEMLSPKVKDALKGRSEKISALEIASGLDDLKNPYDETINKAIEETQSALMRNADNAGNIGVEEANREKQLIYKALKDSQWGKGQGEVPVKATVRKGASFGLREGIEKAVPEVGPMNKKIGTSIAAMEGVNKQQQKEWYKPLVPFAEAIGTVGGMATGNPWLSAAILARRAAQSPMVLTRGGQALGSKKFGQGAKLAASESSRRIFGG